MPPDDNPSDATSATQVAPTTATVTNASVSGATPQTTKPALTLEDAIKRLADLEHSLNNAKEENARHSKRLSVYDKEKEVAEAAKKAAEEAQLSEIERIKEKHAEAEAKIKQQQAQLVTEKVKFMAKDKGIVNPELIAPYAESKLEYDEATGQPQNLEKVLDDLIKGNPYLVVNTPASSPSPAQTQPAQTQTATPAIPAMNPGRQSIAQPGMLTPGTVPSWNQIYKRP